MAYRALSFDCYGTLIDWEAGIWAALQPLLGRVDRPVPERSEMLALFAELESAEQAARPAARYPDILIAVYRGLAQRLGVPPDALAASTFGASVGAWPAFADSAAALRRLGERYLLVVLSNVDRHSFARSARRLGVTFDAVYTAEDVGSYKPDPANFEFLVEHVRADLGIDAPELLHVAQSVFHDLVPGSRAGLDLAWVDRQSLAAGGAWGATAPVAEIPETTHVVASMAELADLLCGDTG